ncbi:phosphatidylethanolamine N-methyltransferase [Anomaloglossus baeobatrachus]|uniref:phosphatidylethanolamine N-methyltransferase n=1 Tax=Anomaloglossus baeobatrachus TaxID=238106 RepID=UPI003F50BB5F
MSGPGSEGEAPGAVYSREEASVARWEYHTQALSRFFGSPYIACYILGALIILLAIFRSHCFTAAISSQPHSWILERPEFYYVGVALVASGGALVITSFLALGFVGTYLGNFLHFSKNPLLFVTVDFVSDIDGCPAEEAPCGVHAHVYHRWRRGGSDVLKK